MTGNVAGNKDIGGRLSPRIWYLPAPQYSVMVGQGVQERGLVVDLRQVVFSLYDAITVNAVLQHGTGNFQSGLELTF